MQARFPGKCYECRKSVSVGDPICLTGGRWVHEACMERLVEQRRVIGVAQAAHRGDMDEIQYSVSYSRGQAMNWALENGVISQAEYDLVRKNRDYLLLWNYVSD